MSKKKKAEDLYTRLTQHRRNKKELLPPYMTLPSLKFTSWVNDRMPEVLWMVLITGVFKREESLNAFRHIAEFVRLNPVCYDLRLSKIHELPKKVKTELIEHICKSSIDASEALRPLMLFPTLPSSTIWSKYLIKPKEKEDWLALAQAVNKNFWHQSQEATDCRWLKVLCMILAKKMIFPKSLEKSVKEIFEYPNRGNQKKVRPLIRAKEMVPNQLFDKTSYSWPEDFWKYCLKKTPCISEEIIDKSYSKARTQIRRDIEKNRQSLFDETYEIEQELIKHFFLQLKNTHIDPRLETSFGLALFALSLLQELAFFGSELSITGRLQLRTLVELNITFRYLLSKEEEESNIWSDFRGYGTGQLKLALLKLKELGEKIDSIDLEILEDIVNEDTSVEFVPINLGHWDAADLRTMSEKAGIKTLYDKYYGYTSAYVHAHWGALREAAFLSCFNPLHRYHRIPDYDLPLLGSVKNDAKELTNIVLDCLSEAFPAFKNRLE